MDTKLTLYRHGTEQHPHRHPAERFEAEGAAEALAPFAGREFELSELIALLPEPFAQWPFEATCFDVELEPLAAGGARLTGRLRDLVRTAEVSG